MGLYYELPVYRDTYQLILKIFEFIKHFSREYKFTLGQDMKRDVLKLVRNIYRANKSDQKTVHLEEFNDNYELIKRRIALGRRLSPRVRRDTYGIVASSRRSSLLLRRNPD